MLISQIIPPSPSPTESKRLFYTSVSFLLSHLQGYRYHLSKFHIICVSILYWCFSFWLTSLCIKGSSFIHLIRTDSNVFFLMCAHLCMKCSLAISNFLEEVSCLSHSIVFLYFFALITEDPVKPNKQFLK